MNTKTLLLSATLVFGGCSTTDWLSSNTSKAVLAEIGNLVFTTALQSFSNSNKADFGHSMAQGLWENSASALTSGAVSRIAGAWSADHLPKLATTTSTAYQIANPKTPKQKGQVIDAIATAIDQAATYNGYVALPNLSK